MTKKYEIGVVGLGKFGLFAAQRLMELGHDVVGLDVDQDRVRSAQDVLTQVYQGDGTDPAMLEQLGFQEFDTVVVSVGDSMEASMLIAMHLKELECEQVWVKAVSIPHEKVLRKVGVDEVFFPELIGAQQLAMRITSPGLIEYLSYGEGILVQKFEVDEWGGKALKDLNLTNRYKLLVIAHKPKDSGAFEYLPGAGTTLQKGDEVLVIMQEDVLEEIEA